MYNNYPVKATNNAKEGILLNSIKKNCNNQIGIKTAKKLIERKKISTDFIKKIYSYLSRAEVYVKEKNKCGYISYQLWGGKEMLYWCKKILNK
jgi:hypothetical protein